MPLFERNSSIRVDRVAEPDENVWISLFDGPPNVRRVYFLVPVAAPESNSGPRCALRKERDEHESSILSAAFSTASQFKSDREETTRGEREKEKIPKTVTKEIKEIAQRRTRRGGISSLFAMARAPARRTEEQEEDQEEEESESKKKKSPPESVVFFFDGWWS